MMLFKKKQVSSNNRSSSQRLNSNPGFSYYNNRPNRQANNIDPKAIKKSSKRVDLKYHLKHIPSYLIVIVIVGSVLYSLTLTIRPRIILGKSNSGSNLLRDKKVYEQRIRQILESSIFNRTKLTINTESVSKQIEKEFPEIQHSTVRLPIVGREAVIGLEPAIPAFILASGTSRYIIGSDGRALVSYWDTNASLSTYLLTVVDDSKIEIKKGEVALPKDYVDFITTVMLQLKAKNVSIKALQLPNLINELRVVTTEKDYYIKFDMNGDARLQTGTFLAIRERFTTQNTNPIEYIDVRVPERSYYK